MISNVGVTDGQAPPGFTDRPAAQREFPWFCLTDHGSVSNAVAPVRAGTLECLTKAFDIERPVGMIHEAGSPATATPAISVLGTGPAMRQDAATRVRACTSIGTKGVGLLRRGAQSRAAVRPPCYWCLQRAAVG